MMRQQDERQAMRKAIRLFCPRYHSGEGRHPVVVLPIHLYMMRRVLKNG